MRWATPRVPHGKSDNSTHPIISLLVFTLVLRYQGEPMAMPGHFGATGASSCLCEVQEHGLMAE